MKVFKSTILALAILAFAHPAKAGLSMSDIAENASVHFSAHSYVVMDQVTGEVILQKSKDSAWVPASLTKVVTALVVLDNNPDIKKVCTISGEDEVGGARLNATKNGKYRLGDLLDATLVASANNAANALADCIMDRASFVKAMNAKAKQLGAKNTVFYEPSGIDPRNTSTAADLASILRAGFSTLKIQAITQKPTVYFASFSSPKRVHNLKTTNNLLKDKAVKILAGKTGYLDESRYNFGISSKSGGKFLITVVLGNPTKNSSFQEAKELSELAPSKFAFR